MSLAASTLELQNLAVCIDHTLLKPEARESDFEKLCREAKEFSFYSVCIPGSWLELARDELANSSVKLCSVAGFPLGSQDRHTKMAEIRSLLELGADEVDMVLNIGKLKSGLREAVFDELKAAREATGDRVLKIIIETTLLSRDEKIVACELVSASGADFVKTSTGFAGGGATIEDIQLMKEIVGDAVRIKASGGIRNRAFALELLQAGAHRLGTSQSVALVRGDEAAHGY